MPVSTPTGEQGKKKMDTWGTISPRISRGLLPAFIAFNALLAGCSTGDTLSKPVLPGEITSQTPPISSYAALPIELAGIYKTMDDRTLTPPVLSVGISSPGIVSSKFTEADPNNKKQKPLKITVEKVGDDGDYEVKAKVEECIEKTKNCMTVEKTWQVTVDRVGPVIGHNFVSTDTGLFEGSLSITDKTTGVADVKATVCKDEKKQVKLTIVDDNSYHFSLPASIGNNCVDVIATDKVGNKSSTQVNAQYGLDVGFTIKQQVIKDQVILTGTLPKSAKPDSLTASGKQNQWKYLGFEGDIACTNSAFDGMKYTIHCGLPSATGGPARIHVTFEDVNGNKYDAYYKDSDMLIHGIPDPSNFDKNLWAGQVVATLLGFVLAEGIGIAGGKVVGDIIKEKRVNEYLDTKRSGRAARVAEFGKGIFFKVSNAELETYNHLKKIESELSKGRISQALDLAININKPKVKSQHKLQTEIVEYCFNQALLRLEQIEKSPSIEYITNGEVSHLIRALNQTINSSYGQILNAEAILRTRVLINSLRLVRDSYSLDQNRFGEKYKPDISSLESIERFKIMVRSLFHWGNYIAAGRLISKTSGGLRDELLVEFNKGAIPMIDYLIRTGDYGTALSGYGVVSELNPEALKAENGAVDGLLKNIYEEFIEIIRAGDRSKLNGPRIKKIIAVMLDQGAQPWLQYQVVSGYKEMVGEQARELNLISLAEAGTLDAVSAEFAVVQSDPEKLKKIIGIFIRWKDLRTLDYLADHLKDATITDMVIATKNAFTKRLISSLAKQDQPSAIALIQSYRLSPDFQAEIERMRPTDIEIQKALQEVYGIYKRENHMPEQEGDLTVKDILNGNNTEFWSIAYSLSPEKARIFFIAMIAGLKIPRSLVAGAQKFELQDGKVLVGTVYNNQRRLQRSFLPDMVKISEIMTSIRGTPEGATLLYFCETLSWRISDLVEVSSKEYNPEAIRLIDEYIIDSQQYHIMMNLLVLAIPGFRIKSGESVMIQLKDFLVKNML